MKKYILLISAGLVYGSLRCQPLLPYKDSTLPVEQRVQDLLSRMRPEEKFWQLFMLPGDLDHAGPAQYKEGIFGFQVSAAAKGDAAGQLLRYGTAENALSLAKKINGIQRYFVEKTRLGIPILAFDEALHGLVRGDATVFPQAIGLAATFDTALVHAVALAIATETKARGIRQVLSPVINIASDVRWGRVEETYGEDPLLSARMAVAFVTAFEKNGIITTPKHFVANVGDGGRDSYPIHFNERLLDEIYLAPFKACFEEGGSRSVMTAYNSLDGVSCSANSWLLQNKLKGEWHFNGFVISDANAVGGDVVLHHTAADYAEAGQHAISNGLDVIFQTDYKHHSLFIGPFLDGGIDSNRINDAVARVLRAKFALGLFEHPYASESEAKRWTDNDSHRNLARRAACESFVLLKNEKNILPFSSRIKRLAVIGEDAVDARLGGYSGPGRHKQNILDGIKQRAGSAIRVSYEPGCGRSTKEWVVVPAEYLSIGSGDRAARGLRGEYFNNISLGGNPVVSRIDRELNFSWTLSPPDKALDPDFYSARWTGRLRAPVSGKINIGLDGNDGYRLYINDVLLIDNWRKQTYSTRLVPVDVEKGRTYAIRVEFFEPNGNAHIKLIWNAGLQDDWRARIDRAVAAARQSDLALIVAGITEGEFQDRAMLNLPGHQEELIRRVAATGRPVVVLLVGGSAITMNAWQDGVQGIADLWYPGEAGGDAVADLLFGDCNPAGRLPISFPLSEAQLPLVYNHKPTGRGDDYNNLSGLPLYPFGFGLSYTQFEYSGLQIENPGMAATDSTWVRCQIKNTGGRDGDEVVQLYIRDILSSVATPVMALKGFQRIHLAAGETREIRFLIGPGMLRLLDKQMHPVLEPGDFRIMIGASSRDIRLKGTLSVRS